MRIKATIQDETWNIQEYIKKMVTKDELLSECLRQQKPNGSAEEEEHATWRDKPQHGMYHRPIEEVADIEKTY